MVERFYACTWVGGMAVTCLTCAVTHTIALQASTSSHCITFHSWPTLPFVESGFFRAFSPWLYGFGNSLIGVCARPGGGVTNLLMPRLQEGLAAHMPVFVSWRVAFFIPGVFQVLAGLVILSLAQVSVKLLPRCRSRQPSCRCR